MRKDKIVKRQDLIKHNHQMLDQLRAKLCDRGIEALQELMTSFEGELSDLALFVIHELMEQEIEELAGLKHQHQCDRTHTRWGNNPGAVILNGKKVFTTIPRVLDCRTKQAYSLKSHGMFQSAQALVKRAYRDLIRGISSRKYKEGVTKFLHGYSASASAVSRRMIEATSAKVKELMSRDLQDLDCCVLMIDGIHFGGHTVVVVLGIDSKGVKHILGLWQGATENARVVKSALEDLVERHLSLDRAVLVVIDGSKALRRAVKDVLGEEMPVQRCTVHKRNNVLDELADQHKSWVGSRMTKAYQMDSAQTAEQALTRLAEEVERVNPSAVRSLREGLSETLTLQRLGIPHLLKTSLQTTNMIESVNSVLRQRTHNVKCWQDGNHVERWVAAGLLEAEKQFNRVKGFDSMPILVDALFTLKKNRPNVA